MFAKTPRRSLAGQVLAVQLVILCIVVALAAVMAYRQAVRQVTATTQAHVRDVAHTIAIDPSVAAAAQSPDPHATLQPFATRVQRETGSDFVVIMSPAGLRWTHPNQSLIGQQFNGTFAPAASGREVLEDYVGTLGPSTRAVVPVFEPGSSRVVALVSVGVRKNRAEAALRELIPDMLSTVVAVALLSGAGAWFLVRRVRRQTLGLNAAEIARMNDHHDAVLYAVREGLVIVSTSGRVEVINAEATRLLNFTGPDVTGRQVEDLDLAPPILGVLTAAHQVADEPLVSAGRILLASANPVVRHRRQVATVVTLRDRTELEALTGELTTTKALADALHAQAHESANRLHCVVSLIELGRSDEAVRFATEELQHSERLTDSVLAAIDEPAVAALLLGKLHQAAERGVTLEVDPEAHLPQGCLPTREVVTMLGNLIDNAMDALTSSPGLDERTITVDVGVTETTATLTVADTGPGIAEEARAHVFDRGWSTKPSESAGGRGLGLSLVQQQVSRLGGSLAVSEPPGAVFTIVLPVRPGAFS